MDRVEFLKFQKEFQEEIINLYDKGFFPLSMATYLFRLIEQDKIFNAESILKKNDKGFFLK